MLLLKKDYLFVYQVCVYSEDLFIATVSVLRQHHHKNEYDVCKCFEI